MLYQISQPPQSKLRRVHRLIGRVTILGEVSADHSIEISRREPLLQRSSTSSSTHARLEGQPSLTHPFGSTLWLITSVTVKLFLCPLKFNRKSRKSAHGTTLAMELVTCNSHKKTCFGLEYKFESRISFFSGISRLIETRFCRTKCPD